MLRARSDDRGYVLVVSMLVLVVMLLGGLALLTVVDTQSQASGKQRDADASFNLAESAANSAAFVLSRNWSTQSAQQSWSKTPCSSETISGGVGTTTATDFAGQIQSLVAQTSAARGGPSNATWDVKVCAAPSGTSPLYTDSALTGAGYDTGTGRLWVRAQATVNGRKSAVATMVAINGVSAAIPNQYSILAGSFSFASGTSETVADLLTGSTLAPYVNMMLQNNKLVEGGAIGVRCGIATCPTLAANAAITSVPLLQNTLGTQQVYQVGTPTAASSSTIAGLRAYAATQGSYVAQVADGAPCIPSTITPPSDQTKWTVFVEKVGNNGDGTCTLNADGSQHAGVIVGSGRVNVVGSNYFMGVVYGLNLQSVADGKARPIVTVSQGAKVKGSILVDYGGTVALYPPTVNLCQLQNLGTFVGCLLGGLIGTVTDTLNSILSRNTPTNLVVQIRDQQMTQYGPAVSYDASIASRLQVTGTTGAVYGTFRSVKPY